MVNGYLLPPQAPRVQKGLKAYSFVGFNDKKQARRSFGADPAGEKTISGNAP